jgi:predicted phosphodiesterase
MAVVACSSQPTPAPDVPPPAPKAVAQPADAALPDAPAAAKSWQFVVISDVHLPNPKRAIIDKTIAAIVEMKPRFVVVAGDHTNGNPTDPPALVAGSTRWWKVVTEALQPLRDAHVAVLPIAGNHDTYLPGQRSRYAAAFDLASWAPGFEVHGGDKGLSRPPFTYSVDVDGVHLSLIHVASQQLDKDVAAWLASDLASASKARLRVVISHVPWHSAIAKPRQTFVDQLGAILETGHADAYIGGHEHMVWDDDFPLPHGGSLHEILVGCISGWYNYGPTKESMTRAHCAPVKAAGKRDANACTMPHGGGAFTVSRERRNRMIEHAHATFTVITVDGDKLEATPMVLDDAGKPAPFYLTPP